MVVPTPTIYDIIDLSSIVDSAGEMGTSRPTYSFTIPSLYDGIELNCRLFFPQRSHPTSQDLPCKAAVLAHPYAPLGGTYDDPVLSVVTSALLKVGYIVGTFNFRGASGSEGKTSWSGKPELADYVSVLGFMVCFMAHIGRGRDSKMKADGVEREGIEGAETMKRRIICGGYSYGSVMARHAPTADVVMKLFERTTKGSSVEEINLRAAHLARLYFEENKTTARSHTRSQSLGGRESATESDTQSPSHSSKRRHKIDFSSIGRHHHHHHHSSSSTSTTSLAQSPSAGISLPTSSSPLQTSYLLISPPLTLSTGLLTLFQPLLLTSLTSSFDTLGPSPLSSPYPNNIAENATLAIWGRNDGMQSSRSLRGWAKGLEMEAKGKGAPVGAVTSREVEGAGHFWREEGVARRLREEIGTWAEGLEP